VRSAGLLDDATARALEFPWLREQLAPASDYGQRIFAELVPFRPGEESLASGRASQISKLSAALQLSQFDTLREVFRNVPDAAMAIARASMGDTLSDANFLELQRFFDACERVDAIGVPAGLQPTADEAVSACARAIELGRAGKFGFYLDDRFDETLARARGGFERAQAEYDAVRGRAAARVAELLDREIAGNEFIVMRSDLKGTLPQGVRVVREAPTYFLCELDADEATLAALQRRDEAATTVAEAEEAVRARLSHVIRSYAAALDLAARRFGESDVMVAAARFSKTFDCVAPAYSSEKLQVVYDGGRFLPLAVELERDGRAFTAVSISLDDIAVLTGPNMGGKSVVLRTSGFIAVCAAFGVPVPAVSASVGLFDEITWLGVGADEDFGGLLSSFAREVLRFRDMLGRTRERRFVLMDEFARTTTPREGRALLIAVIERLRLLRAVGLSATHLAGIAPAAAVRHFAVRGLRGIPEKPATSDLSAALATLAASMDYTIEEIEDESERRSDAIALAALLGLDSELIASAYDELT